jgi:hypothetical protein
MQSQLATTYPALGVAGSPQNKEFVDAVHNGTVTPDNAWVFGAGHSYVAPDGSASTTSQGAPAAGTGNAVPPAAAPSVDDIVAGVQSQSKQQQDFANKKASGELPANATDTGATLDQLQTQAGQLNSQIDRFGAKNGITFSPAPQSAGFVDLSPERGQQVSRDVSDWTNSRNGFGSGTSSSGANADSNSTSPPTFGGLSSPVADAMAPQKPFQYSDGTGKSADNYRTDTPNFGAQTSSGGASAGQNLPATGPGGGGTGAGGVAFGTKPDDDKDSL